MHSLAVCVIGITSILMQVTVLRQLISVFSGNELVIGITLSVWLTAVGLGSLAASRLKGSPGAFALSFAAVAVLAPLTALAINFIRPALGAGFGETIAFLPTLVFTVACLAPLCALLGGQFPLAVSCSQGQEGPKVYGIEAAGALAGGVFFTLILAGRADAFHIAIWVSALNAATAVLLLRRGALLFLLMPAFLFLGAVRISAPPPGGAELIDRADSKYGELTVLKTGEQFNLYSSGKLQFAYPEPQGEELKAHLPMSIRPASGRVLLIGGSPAVAREFLKYPIPGIDFVEIDPETVKMAFGLLSAHDREKILSDKRLRVITADARRFIKKSLKDTPRYDLVVFNLPEPSTANINRLYTVEFFRELKAAMHGGGMLILSLPTSSGYMGRGMRLANGSVFGSLREVFSNLEVSSEEYGVMCASDSFIETNPRALSRQARPPETKHFHPHILEDAFDPLKTSMVKTRLEGAAFPNSDKRPVAYLYNLVLWAEAEGGNLLMPVVRHGEVFLAAFMIVLFALWVGLLRGDKKKIVYYSIATTGYASMAFSMVIILACQAAFGYVYEMLGLLSAAFMGGAAFGAIALPEAKRPLRQLKALGGLTAGLMLASPFLMGHEALFYALILVAGMAAGAEFAASGRLMRKAGNPASPGRLYAFDLIGSCPGAFLTAVFFVPMLGIHNTVFFVVLIKSVAVGLLFSVNNEAS